MTEKAVEKATISSFTAAMLSSVVAALCSDLGLERDELQMVVWRETEGDSVNVSVVATKKTDLKELKVEFEVADT